jgi:hypothetical protein
MKILPESKFTFVSLGVKKKILLLEIGTFPETARQEGG